MTDPIRVSAERVIYTFSPDHVPVVTVEPGATLAVETRDAYDRQFQRSRDVAIYLHEKGSRPTNPATGPIAIRGARRGDGLNVTITAIKLGPVGYVAATPGIGVLGDTAVVARISPFEVREGAAWFEGRLRLPLRPMLGVIGVAPAEGAIPCMELGYHGGNLDMNDITVGTTLHLPVWVDGANLALGDAHATMGFGEVHSGVNIDAEVTLQVVLVPQALWDRPWFETETEVMTIGVAKRVDEAIREATLAMVQFLQARLGVSYTEAIVLAGAVADLRLGQASVFGTRVSVYAALRKSILS